MYAKVRFGVYELDVAGVELRKNGIRIRLQEQPFRILATLVDRPGEVVTREELKDRIWADHTFVDFDQSLNKAVNRLREVLNDDPSQPRFIETVPRRGYRFVAHVTDLNPPIQTPQAASTRPRSTGIRIGIIAAAAAVVFVAIVAAVIFFLNPPRKRTPGEPQLLTPDAFSPTLSRDGKLLAYVSTVGGEAPHIWVRQTAGGKAIQVTRGPARDFAPDLSPDGTQILFASDFQRPGIYMAPTFPGESRLVLPDAYWARFSPDGQTILCLDAGGRVLTLAADHGTPAGVEPINRDYQLEAAPLWSPTGKIIMFFGHRNGQTATSDSWWLAALSGGMPKRLAIPVLEIANRIQPNVYDWTQQRGGSTFVTYSVQEQDTWHLFRIQVTPEARPVGNPELLSSGAGLLDSVSSVSDDGKIVYTVTALNEQIFKIPIGSEGQKLGPVEELPLPEGALYYSPSTSRDGRWMVYIETDHGKRNVLTLRDFATGTDRVLDSKPGDLLNAAASISPDGSKAVFSPYCTGGLAEPDCPSFLVSASGGNPEQICRNCIPRGFSSDASFVLMQKLAGARKDYDKIVAVDLVTKREREFLRDPGYGLYHPYLSWDDRWVVFKRLIASPKGQILITPVEHGNAADSAEWIAVTDGQFGDDKPQLSPDGNTVYFTSDRDGYLCIWTQRLNPKTKHPVGPATPYEHFHNSMGRDAASYTHTQWMSDLTVARDKILINLPRYKHDLWTVQAN